MPLNLLNGISETQTKRTSSSDLLLDEAMGSLLIVVPAIFALAFSFYLYKKINQIKLYRQTRGQDDDDLLMRRMESVGDELENGASANGNNDQYRKLRQIYRDIQEGAKAFLAAEYRMCVYFLIAFGSFISVFVSRTDDGWDFKVGSLTAFAFLVGGVTSMVSGYIGMMIAVFSNARCTMQAAKDNTQEAWKESFNCAFRGGAVMGFALSGLGLLVMYFMMICYSGAFNIANGEAIKLFECIAGFGLGGSSIAMFGRVGGGIYTVRFVQFFIFIIYVITKFFSFYAESCRCRGRFSR